MDRNDVKRKLWAFANEKKRLKYLIEVYREMLTDFGVGAQALTGMPRGGGVSNTPERINLNLDYYAERINALSDALKISDVEFDGMVSCLDGAEKLIVTLRHIGGVWWDFVAERVGYSNSGARKVYNRAIDKILKNLKE